MDSGSNQTSLMHKKKLQIVGSVGGEVSYTPSEINTALTDNQQTLALRSEFTGRPATRIFADASSVVKIRAELKLTVDQARRWISNTLAKEQNLAVHHPRKTWFYIYSDDAGEDPGRKQALIGNISPRMKPLHMILGEAPESDSAREQHRHILAEVFRLCLLLAKEKEVKLDEGLSNFTLDSDGVVYYVDDEYYHWDRFISFSAMLGVYIRSFSWLDQPFVEWIAEDLKGLLDTIFKDINCRATIAYQLRSSFMPGGKKRELANLLSDLLIELPRGRRYGQDAAERPVRKAPPVSTIQAVLEDKIDLAAVKQSGPVKAAEEEVSAEAVSNMPASERYLALIADVHSNLPALESVLQRLQEMGVTQGVVLGDIVGYGPDPEPVIERIRATGFDVIKGNHDHATALNEASRGFSKNAQTVVEWTARVLNEECRDWLMYLPPIIEKEEWMAVHGAPIDPEFFYGYVYAMTYGENLDRLQQLKRRLCFHGHSHMPGVYVRDTADSDHYLTTEVVSLKGYRHCLICPGSVGQPRNGNPDAQFAVLDRALNQVQFMTAAYDYEAVVERMKAEDFPAALWMRLPKGQ